LSGSRLHGKPDELNNFRGNFPTYDFVVTRGRLEANSPDKKAPSCSLPSLVSVSVVAD